MSPVQNSYCTFSYALVTLQFIQNKWYVCYWAKHRVLSKTQRTEKSYTVGKRHTVYIITKNLAKQQQQKKQKQNTKKQHKETTQQSFSSSQHNW